MDGAGNDLQGMILAKLTSIESTLGTTAISVARLEERVSGSLNVDNDHEARLRSLEHWKWGLTGVSALITIAFGIYASIKGM